MKSLWCELAENFFLLLFIFSFFLETVKSVPENVRDKIECVVNLIGPLLKKKEPERIKKEDS